MLYFTLVPNYVKPEEEIKKLLGQLRLLTLTVRHFFSPSFMFIGRGGMIVSKISSASVSSFNC